MLAGLDNIRWLQDELVTISHAGVSLDIVGLTCSHKPYVDGPRLQAVLATARPNQAPRERPFTILLYHTPDLAPEAAEAGVDLQLSGHTHGGQVRLPFFGALYAGSLYGKSFEVGTHPARWADALRLARHRDGRQRRAARPFSDAARGHPVGAVGSSPGRWVGLFFAIE